MTVPVPRWDASLLTPAGRLSPEWYRYLKWLGDSEEASADAQPEYKLMGAQSIRVSGLLQDGLASVALVNDATSPDGLSFYGTDEDGAKGWHGLMPRVMARLSMRL